MLKTSVFLCVLLVVLTPIFGQTVAISGNVVTGDNVGFNGYYLVKLPVSTVTNTCGTHTQNVPFAPVRINVTNGVVSSTQLYATDCLKPHYVYSVTLYDRMGKSIYSDNWYIPNISSVDIGLLSSVKLANAITVAVPYALITSPTGNQTVTQPGASATDFVGTNPLTVNGHPVVTSVASGVASVSGDGLLITNVTSTGGVTLTVGSAPLHKFWNGAWTQPAYADISGTPQLAQTLANVTHKWLNSYNATTGLFTQTQPACGDLSDAATGCSATALPPNGSATGDLSGSYPNPTVAGVNGAALPLSAGLTGTDASRRVIAATAAGIASIKYAAGGGSADVQTLTLTPALAAYAAGICLDWLPTAANATGTPTLNVNSLGAITITKYGTQTLAPHDLDTDVVARACYDGTRFQLQNPKTRMVVLAASNTQGANYATGTSYASAFGQSGTTSGTITYRQAHIPGSVTSCTITQVEACTGAAVGASGGLTANVNSSSSYGSSGSDGSWSLSWNANDAASCKTDTSSAHWQTIAAANYIAWKIVNNGGGTVTAGSLTGVAWCY